MGTFKWLLRISSMDGQQVQVMDAAVDTAAAYATLPARLLRELGVTPKGKRRFPLASGWLARTPGLGTDVQHVSAG